MLRALILPALVVGLWLGGCESPPTQVVVRLATDLQPEQLDFLRLVIIDDDGTEVLEQMLVDIEIPPDDGFHEIASFGLVPRGGDADRLFEVRVTPSHRVDGALFTTRIRSGFVAERTIRLDLYVPALCIEIAATCEPEETCGITGCVDPNVPASRLPPWDPAEPVPESPEDPRAEGMDAGVSDAGSTDAGSTDAGPAPVDAGADTGPGDAGPGDGCVPAAEVCNTRDDDCDGRSDEGLTMVADPAMCSGLPTPVATYDVLGFMWDEAWVTRRGRLIEGIIEDWRRKDRWSAAVGIPLDPCCGVGNLLGLTDPTGPGTVQASLPVSGGMVPPEPNVDRVTIELDWGAGMVLRNDGAGTDDFVIYEAGSVEPYSVRARATSTGLFGPRRYEHYDIYEFEGTYDANSVGFDLTDLGVPAGGTVDAIRITNLFNDMAAAPDRVDSVTGEGAVFRMGETGWATGSPLLTRGGSPIPTSALDSDLVWVVATHPPIPATCCVTP